MTRHAPKPVSGIHGVIGVPRAISAPRRPIGRARINAAIAIRFNWRKFLNAASGFFMGLTRIRPNYCVFKGVFVGPSPP
jgi:hypothetical protein